MLENLIHLCIAGGRKPMAVYGMVTAQLLFDEDDRLWHLLSEGWRPGSERVMHLSPGDRTWLVPVPVLYWSAVSPALTELALRENPLGGYPIPENDAAKGRMAAQAGVYRIQAYTGRAGSGAPGL